MMMKMIMKRLVLVCWILVLAVAVAGAQTTSASGPGGSVAVGFVGGLTTGASTAGGTVGATFTFDVSERLTIETTGAYLDRGLGANALYFNGGLLVNLLPAGRKAVPYAALGGGVYHASFDLDNPRMFGSMMQQSGPGAQLVPIQGMPGFGIMRGYTGQMWRGPFAGPVVNPSSMSQFYANRLGTMMVPPDGRWGMRSFTDPALTIGGGVRLDLSKHLSFRPDVRALVLMGGGRSTTMALFSMSVGYRF